MYYLLQIRQYCYQTTESPQNDPCSPSPGKQGLTFALLNGMDLVLDYPYLQRGSSFLCLLFRVLSRRKASSIGNQKAFLFSEERRGLLLQITSQPWQQPAGPAGSPGCPPGWRRRQRRSQPERPWEPERPPAQQRSCPRRKPGSGHS